MLVMKRKGTKNNLQIRQDAIAKNLAETAGGANIPDPGDVPGGVNQSYDNLHEDAVQAWNSKENKKTGMPNNDDS
jgi:hypothetical protein